MSTLTVRWLDSGPGLRRAADAWDDLWRRSDVALPSMRAELLVQWWEHFTPAARFRALTIERDGCLIAGLPLVDDRAKRLLNIARLPGNEWFPGADLLVDPSASHQVLDLLVAELAKLDRPLLWLDGVNLQSNRWQSFSAALERAGMHWVSRERFRIGVVDIRHDWAAYKAFRASNHRRHMRKAEARALSRGSLDLKVYDKLGASEVEGLLRRGFEIEDASWKGTRGTSVLRTPGVFDFYVRAAQQLAAWGQLKLVFLESAGRPVAFEYGWLSKGVYHSPKVGYDETYADLTPGQLLRLKLLERFHLQPGIRQVDYVGPCSPATEKWSTATYPISRLVVATRGRLGRLVLDAYRDWWPLLRGHRAVPLAGDPLLAPTADSAV